MHVYWCLGCFYSCCSTFFKTRGVQGGVLFLQSHLFPLSHGVLLLLLLPLVTVLCGCAWFFNIFLLLLSLCVDGELVCAEGCTQVTGVMAMMMTGRVLLVCALCVLWCVVCGGCSELTQDPPCNASSKEKPQKEEEAVVGELDQKAQREAPKAPSPKASVSQEMPASPSQAQQSGGGASETAIATMDNKVQKEEYKNEKMEEEAKQKGQEKQQGEEDEGEEEEEEEGRDSKSDSLEEEVEVTIISEQETEEDKKNKSNEAPKETPGGPTNKEETQTATTKVNGQSSPEALEGVKQSEEVQGEKDSNDNPQTKSVASIAANRQNEPSADHGESRPPSPTANGGVANNDSDKSSEDGISNSGPAADAAGTRDEKQNENKDANPKKTPVEATATKNTTATTGDSDGSTAVSHTTSPLLLLLLVACAAAAVAA
ncbi:mucin-associated surface protein (MASP) [Trypanosoma cruzi Dm28c]|uniref:Mucin-associated surface protein (MASP) n=2 Tax=Trypanosoma cruzi TaxID=5693 RepID=V5CHQ0_TRYCR|nr:mucin-associated surface protein (MASP) [Trypanosoma cruzi Dm28c]